MKWGCNMWLKIKFHFALVTMVFLFSGICFSAGPDPEGNYYISTKYPADGYDGNIKEWTVTVGYLGLIKTDGTLIDVMTSSVSLNLLTANKESIAGYFKTGASLPTGNYKQVRITQRYPSTMKGWIKIGSDFYYTKNASPNYIITNNATTAEAGAETITIQGTDVTDDVPGSPTGYVTVEEGNSYELRIFWYAVGLESGNGVGLVFYIAGNEFIDGMLCEQFILHNNTTGTDQYFTGD